MRATNRVAVLMAIAVTVAACNDPASPEAVAPQLGILQLEGYTGPGMAMDRDTTVRWTLPPGEGDIVPADILVVPGEVAVGQPFAFSVTTIGEGGCMSAESLDIDMSGRTVELTPYDVHSGHQACTMNLLSLLHEGTLTLGAPGEWTIRVSGRKARHGDVTWETPVSAEKVILVH